MALVASRSSIGRVLGKCQVSVNQVTTDVSSNVSTDRYMD